MSRDAGDGEEAYRVGRGKPPREYQYKPGVSGNPRGRPKGSPNLKTLLEEELSSLVPIMENGHRTHVSKLAACVKQMVNKSAMGDQKALSQLLTVAGRYGLLGAEIQDEVSRPDGQDRELLDSIMRKVEAQSSESGAAGTTRDGVTRSAGDSHE